MAANLISPGVSVTVTDDSYFIPSIATTVPLIFLATADEKYQPSGNVLAVGTLENNVVRAITSLKQSVEYFGVPKFKYSNSIPKVVQDSNNTWTNPPDLNSSGSQAQQWSNIGFPHHADARNEYGLFTLNTFLSVGNYAYVMRANVNLDDDIDSLRSLWDRKMSAAKAMIENMVQQKVNEINLTAPTPVTGISRTDFVSRLNVVLSNLVYSMYSFSPTYHPLFKPAFETDVTANPILIYSNGFDNASTGTFIGLTGLINEFFSMNSIITPAQAGLLLIDASDAFKYTSEFYDYSKLGESDSDRRAAIRMQLVAAMENPALRAEGIEYNLILCPGYWDADITSAMLSLNESIKEEALVIADMPMDMDFMSIYSPFTGWSGESSKKTSPHIAYYYPHALMNNLDGREVLAPASAIALQTIAYSDNVSYPWFAPAGIRRGQIVGINELGYASGVTGEPNDFVKLHVNQGERDQMYSYTAVGGTNPLVFFPGRGFLVWGQKTSTRETASAMDRINVSRLVKYIARGLRKGAMPFVFEPNDSITRNSLKAMIDGYLADIVIKRGLYDFAVICDDSNNTPVRIDRNELWADVVIKPVKSAEFIYIPIRIVATGAAMPS